MAPSLDVSNSSELQEQHQVADKFDESAEIGDFGPGSLQEYDPAGPSAASAVPIQSPSAGRPAASETKQTIGGFIVGDDSDEEEEAAQDAPVSAPTSYLQAPDPSSGNQAASQDRSPATNVNNGVAQATGASFPIVNAQQDVPDQLASLEKRIKDDARGEMDAWLALIGEHRRRNRVDETRSAYERFLTVFPQAVSSLFLLPTEASCLLMEGLLTRRLVRPLLGQSGSSSSSAITTSPRQRSSLVDVSWLCPMSSSGPSISTTSVGETI
jgi:hypothetical protein